MFLKLYSKLSEFADSNIGLGIFDDHPLDIKTVKRILFDTLQENRHLLDEQLIQILLNLEYVNQLGDCPLADISFIEIVEDFVYIMATRGQKYTFFPDALKIELPILAGDYRLWAVLSKIGWDVKKAAKVLYLKRHLGGYDANEILSSNKFKAIIDEYNEGKWGSSLNDRREFFGKVILEILDLKLSEDFFEMPEDFFEIWRR